MRIVKLALESADKKKTPNRPWPQRGPDGWPVPDRKKKAGAPVPTENSVLTIMQVLTNIAVFLSLIVAESSLTI